MRFSSLSFVSLALIIAHFTLPAKAATLFEDNFSGAAGSSVNGKWKGYGNGVDSELSINGDNSMKVTLGGSKTTHDFCLGLPQVSLKTPGDFLKVSFDFKPAGAGANQTKVFKFGLFEKMDTQIADRGYYAQIPWTGDNLRACTLNVDTGGKARFMTSAASNGDCSPLSAESTNYGISTTNTHSLALVLTRTETAINLNLEIAGYVFSWDDSVHKLSDFSGFAFQEYEGATNYFLSNFEITTNVAVVPEPSTYAWLLAGTAAAAGVVGLRRRKRE